jgi:hypothetical protein
MAANQRSEVGPAKNPTPQHAATRLLAKGLVADEIAPGLRERFGLSEEEAQEGAQDPYGALPEPHEIRLIHEEGGGEDELPERDAHDTMTPGVAPLRYRVDGCRSPCTRSLRPSGVILRRRRT